MREEADGGSDLDLALRVWRHVYENVTYGRVERPNTAALVLQWRKGQCGEYGKLTIALLRANGIPARGVWCVRADAWENVDCPTGYRGVGFFAEMPVRAPPRVEPAPRAGTPRGRAALKGAGPAAHELIVIEAAFVSFERASRPRLGAPYSCRNASTGSIRAARQAG